MEQSSPHKLHILPLRTYLTVAAVLFVLTAVTVGVSKIDLGGWNVVVAISIASVKALFVAFFFMHLLYDHKINLFVFIIAVSFVAVFIIFTMFDTLRRADIYESKSAPIKEEARIYDNLLKDGSTDKSSKGH